MSGEITEFSVPTAKASPYGIATAPDGTIWFTEQAANKIGKLTFGARDEVTRKRHGYDADGLFFRLSSQSKRPVTNAAGSRSPATKTMARPSQPSIRS